VAPCMPATAMTNRSRTCMLSCPGRGGATVPHDGPPGLAGRANNPRFFQRTKPTDSNPSKAGASLKFCWIDRCTRHGGGCRGVW
jgi:hypothetical protein